MPSAPAARECGTLSILRTLESVMPSPCSRLPVLPLLLLCACATPTSGPAPAAGSPPARGASGVPAAPDPARVYADLLGKSEDLPSVLRAPKQFEGRSIVLYGLRNGDPRQMESSYSMPLAATDGRPVVAAIDRAANNQFYLLLADDFAREARERKMLAGARGSVFVECRVSAQTTGRITSYPCEVTRLALVSDNRITDLLGRASNRALEYYRY